VSQTHTHEYVLVTTRPDGTRIYGCVGCEKTKTVLTTDQLIAMVNAALDEDGQR
jgi:hypothetical protein